MKQAPFRLQPVLELRRTEERAAAVASARAAQSALEAAERAELHETTLAAAVLPRSLPAGDFTAAMTLLRIAATDASDARAAAIASAQQAEAVRAEWTAAAQRTKALERLRERHREAQARAAAAAEERAVDDLVTGRAGRPTTEELPWTG
ncbi:flagellar export protein FliJ [Blastococcus sp. TML/M2B]|uniref:flagellar export protein FliJ n=1 Tax=unclassified Blastococcus TaxID=2619396 RepID=UPI0019090FAF|nr:MULTISPECIES: flagellar export protein FliJ [unclassified Blastococcus]MBN1091611.1 flagellar export protein FliJ [Blastococcus sp. TML/M2B]MBN1094834.1 flagellar export protein FliJ [Blastococcus sp. TML/C7B]